MREYTEFSGISGRVLRGSFSFGTMLSGVALTIVLFSGWYFFIRWGMEAAATLYSEFVIALALARYAMNGLYGEWQGTIFSAAGGPWTRAVAVAGRYLLLTALWLVPLLVVGLSFSKAGPELFQTLYGGGGSELITLVLLYILGMTLTPPVFLIVSVTADKLSDLFSASHWRRVLGGRLGDLFFIYVLYIGGSLSALVLCIPPTIEAFGQGPEMGVSVTALACAALVGLSVNLLGRLCGFFAFGEPEPAAGSAPVPAPGRIVPSPASPPPQPALLDAQARADEARRRFAQDPAGAIASLEELRVACAPSPQILHALCLMQAQAGRKDAALATARKALPLCLERGNLRPAAEIFRALAPQMADLGLNREQTLGIASAFVKMNDLGFAAHTYGEVVRMDAGERRAIKGLMQIADARLRDPQGIDEAIKIYKFLLQRCAASPLADDMRRGLEEAERRLARAARPVG